MITKTKVSPITNLAISQFWEIKRLEKRIEKKQQEHDILFKEVYKDSEQVELYLENTEEKV